MRAVLLLLAVILAIATTSVRGAGLRRIDVPAGAKGTIIQAMVWYPCAAPPERISLGPFLVSAVPNCPISVDKLPLVIISHGRAGSFLGHHDTAEALANNGFIVAALNHPGDTAQDPDRTDDLSVWVERPNDVVRLIDYLTGVSLFSVNIDQTRIGFFGFSRGGYTGLALIGADADWAVATTFCRQRSWRLCRQVLKKDFPATPLAHDPRIKAAVLADPPAPFFSAKTLASIKVPVQLWASEYGGDGVAPQDVVAIHEELRTQQDYRMVPNARHFAFFTPCSVEMAALAAEACSDATGFDRPAFHQHFNADVVGFFLTMLDRSTR
jgi:predicted dienelactone hydrolase